MAKMCNSTLLLLFILAACATARAGNPSTGLDAACKKTPDPDFCALLLQPSAADFDGGDPTKMEFAAINATIGKVLGVKTFLMEKALRGAKDLKLKNAVMDCVDNFRHSEGSLKVALRELNTTGEAHAPKEQGKNIPIKMVGIASTELNNCHDVMKKSEATAAAGEDADITKELLRSAEESAKACAIAKYFVEDKE